MPDYDGKNQLLVMQSKDKPLWAFSLFGKGIERHRFQLVMVPANEGTRSIVYAYHTGYQEQVDLTPDSEQTLLVLGRPGDQSRCGAGIAAQIADYHPALMPLALTVKPGDSV